MNTDLPHADRGVIVALDFDHRRAAEALVERLGDACDFYKIGLELLTAAGPGLARDLVARGHEVFLDLKLFEIPNSVAGAVRAACALGASMVTVHAMGGTGIMSAAVEAAREFPRLRVLALTVVTSMTGSDLADIGVAADTEEQVLRLARLAEGAGCDGVIASPGRPGRCAGSWGRTGWSSRREWSWSRRAARRAGTPGRGRPGPPSRPGPRTWWWGGRSLGRRTRSPRCGGCGRPPGPSGPSGPSADSYG